MKESEAKAEAMEKLIFQAKVSMAGETSVPDRTLTAGEVSIAEDISIKSTARRPRSPGGNAGVM
ncbi:hypothetical protein DYI26_14580 [Halomonas litopenaei]|nr:hypothetical protein [Halomonas litopenaei]